MIHCLSVRLAFFNPSQNAAFDIVRERIWGQLASETSPGASHHARIPFIEISFSCQPAQECEPYIAKLALAGQTRCCAVMRSGRCKARVSPFAIMPYCRCHQTAGRSIQDPGDAEVLKILAGESPQHGDEYNGGRDALGRYHGYGELLRHGDDIERAFQYKGSFCRGQFHGYGVHLTLMTHIMYEGQAMFGQAHGRGVLSYAGKTRDFSYSYIGEFSADWPHGRGVMERNGWRWEGRMDSRQSLGSSLTSYGGILAATPKDDESIRARADVMTGAIPFSAFGLGVLTSNRGFTARGEFRRGKLNGYAIGTLPDGSRIEGKWENGDASGACLQSLGHEYTYRGQMARGLFHGLGVEEKGDERYDGFFKKGLRHGTGILIGKKRTISGIFHMGLPPKKACHKMD